MKFIAKSFPVSVVVLASVLSACGGGGGSSSDPLSGSYSGGTIGGGVNKTSGTVTATVDGHGNFKCTLIEDTTPATTIVFSGVITAAQASAQAFTALETGGPYNGQTVHVFYQKSTADPQLYPKGFEKVTIFVPPGATTNAWLFALTANGTGTTL